MPSIQDRFTEADALYQLRESNPPGIAAAQNAYLAILDDPTAAPAQKIRAASQLGRLSIYLGEMLTPKDDFVTRDQVFSDCWNGFIEKINPTLVGENPAYYYFKGVCLAYWIDTVPLSKFIFQITTLLQMIENGQKPANWEFEGGGPFRMEAFVRGNTRIADVPIPGIHPYDPEVALTAIQRALASPGMADPETGETISGQEFYENWLAQGKVYMEIYDKVADAKNAYVGGIEQILADFSVGSTPTSRTFEAAWVLATSLTQLDALN